MCEECYQFTCPSGCPNANPIAQLICSNCGQDIFLGDTYYEYGNEPFCDKYCAEKWFSENCLLKKECEEN